MLNIYCVDGLKINLSYYNNVTIYILNIFNLYYLHSCFLNLVNVSHGKSEVYCTPPSIPRLIK